MKTTTPTDGSAPAAPTPPRDLAAFTFVTPTRAKPTPTGCTLAVHRRGENGRQLRLTIAASIMRVLEWKIGRRRWQRSQRVPLEIAQLKGEEAARVREAMGG